MCIMSAGQFCDHCFCLADTAGRPMCCRCRAVVDVLQGVEVIYPGKVYIEEVPDAQPPSTVWPPYVLPGM